MPHSIFFTKRGHAIHGSFDTRRLGSPASAGCVRLHPDNAKQLFALVEAAGRAQHRGGDRRRRAARLGARGGTAKSRMRLRRKPRRLRRNRARRAACRNTTTMMSTIRAPCRRAIGSRPIASPDIRRHIHRRRPATTTHRSRRRRAITTIVEASAREPERSVNVRPPGLRMMERRRDGVRIDAARGFIESFRRQDRTGGDERRRQRVRQALRGHRIE